MAEMDPAEPPLDELIDDVSPIETSRGAGLLISLGERCTLMEYFTDSKPGGLITSAQRLFGGRTLRSTIEGMVEMAREDNLMVGYRELRQDEFWARGHLPGRPLFPGVLMCECLAQVASVHAHIQLELPEDLFLGFAGLDNVRFRAPVEPGTKLWAAGRIKRASKQRLYFKWDGQLITEAKEIVCEATVTGMAF